MQAFKQMELMCSDYERLLVSRMPKFLCEFTDSTGRLLMEYLVGDEDKGENHNTAHFVLFKDSV